MVRTFTFTEDDHGTKQRTISGLQRVNTKLSKEFIKAAREYWMRVWRTARMLCIQYGAIDTWTLYNSIRLLWQPEGYGGLFEVGVSTRGASITAMIKVGGGTFINPKTGRLIDYAQVVHDGGSHPSGKGFFPPRPFLTDAIAINEGFLHNTLSKHVDKALAEFERVY